MSVLSFRDLSAIALPGGDHNGAVLVLRCYLDDSGTHAGSTMLSWGAALGSNEQWSAFEVEWRAFLEAPVQGKPRLRKFSLADCAAGQGEFIDYSPSERDLVRNMARAIIAKSRIFPISVAVAKSFYNWAIPNYLREWGGTAESRAFIPTVLRCLDYAQHINIGRVALVIDQGQRSFVDALVARIMDDAFCGEIVASVTYAKVEEFAPLQAADTIATEGRWMNMARMNGKEPSPHMQHFVRTMRGNETSGPYYVMGPDSILHLKTQLENDLMSSHPIYRGV